MHWKRIALGATSLAVLIGIGYVVWPRGNPPAEHVPPPMDGPLPVDRPIESDLQLRAELKSGGTLTAGANHWVAVALVNTSRTVTHRVVKPGHGSEIGYREPHTTWSATVDRGDGTRVPITDERSYGYCGTCLDSSANWLQDVISLKPGERLELVILQKFEFQRPGRVRLRAHYEYHAGDKRAENGFRPENFPVLEGMAPFKLASNPVEFDVVRPLDVQVRVKRALKVHQNTRLSDFLSVSLVNQSQETIECSSPTLAADARVMLETDSKFTNWQLLLTEETAAYGVTRTLKPGEVVPLLGPGEFANGMDGTWEYPEKGLVRVRAVYTPTTWKPGPRIQSEWVEVRVEE